MTARQIAALFLTLTLVFGACALKRKAPAIVVPSEPTSSAAATTPTPSEPPAESPAATPEADVPAAAAPEITLEAPAPPSEQLARFRSFWLGMSIENWARTALGPAKVEGSETATAESNIATSESNAATSEANVAEPQKPKVKSNPVYRQLPLVVEEAGVARFVYTDPADIGIDHITFRFFKDCLDTMEIFYRTGYFDGVILDDFLSKVKNVYGGPKAEEWDINKERGNLSWDDGTYTMKLTIFNARPFSMILVHSGIRKEEQAYVEELKKTGSAKKVEKLKF